MVLGFKVVLANHGDVRWRPARDVATRSRGIYSGGLPRSRLTKTGTAPEWIWGAAAAARRARRTRGEERRELLAERRDEDAVDGKEAVNWALRRGEDERGRLGRVLLGERRAARLREEAVAREDVERVRRAAVVAATRRAEVGLVLMCSSAVCMT